MRHLLIVVFCIVAMLVGSLGFTDSGEAGWWNVTGTGGFQGTVFARRGTRFTPAVPLAGARVELFRFNTRVPSAVTSADSRGRYSFGGLAAGPNYAIRAHQFSRPYTWYGSVRAGKTTTVNLYPR